MARMGVVEHVDASGISVRNDYVFPSERSIIIKKKNIYVVKGDVVEYDINSKCGPCFIRDTGWIEAAVITSNSLAELPAVQNLKFNNDYWLKYHVVLATNPDCGEFIMTPINTFSKNSEFATTGFACFDKKNGHFEIYGNLVGIKYLPDLLRFCNLKPGDKIFLNRWYIKNKEMILPEYGHIIQQWPNVKGR